jgi:pyruvate kinase
MKPTFNISGRIKTFIILGICCILCNSCFKLNYTAKSIYIPEELKTVSIQYFENMARNVEAGLSQQVTDALKDYIQNNTNKTLVTGNGDINFEGAITGYEPGRPVAITSGDEAAKNRFTITIRVKMTCDSKPDLDFESSFSRYEDYLTTNNFEDIKSTATESILKLLIEDIFNRAFVNW